MNKMDELEKIKKKMLQERWEKIKKDDEKEETEMETEIEVNDDNFKERVMEKSKQVPVVVDFWAGWCTPCLSLSPRLEELASSYDGKFVLAKLNVDKNKRTAMKYGIRGIPAVKMFKDGEVTDEFVGALPASAVKTWLDKNLD